MRILVNMTVAVTIGASVCAATTLQKLSMDEMIQKSTSIVRAKVSGVHSAFRGQDIYTYYQLQVLESWNSNAQQLEVAVPGGVVNGMRQMVAGAPALNVGDEYVIFIWTSRSGLSQVMGLSQGLFSVKPSAATGEPMLIRPAASDLMLDKSGHVVSDQPVSLRLCDVRAQIQKSWGAGK